MSIMMAIGIFLCGVLHGIAMCLLIAVFQIGARADEQAEEAWQRAIDEGRG